MEWYAQSGEDRIIAHYFADEVERRKLHPESAPLYFVEVGALDGIKYSNTYALERMGWEGLLIEPNPEAAAACRRNRRAAVLQAACVPSADIESATLYVTALPELSTLTLERLDAIANIHKATGVELTITPVSVPAATLASVLAKSGVPSEFALLSIDTEWRNADTLRGMDFERWRPRLVIVEANDASERGAVATLLQKAGYQYAFTHANNLFYLAPHENVARLLHARRISGV